MKSLDPRVTRLPEMADAVPELMAPLDQFGTFEVFVMPKEGKPFQHEGAVHAPDLEMAFVLAKETFTRRFTCVEIFVVDTLQVFVSSTTEGDNSVYDQFHSLSPADTKQTTELYEIFNLYKRGKQHLFVCQVKASGPEEAINISKEFIDLKKTVYNIWAIRSRDIRFTKPEEKDLWLTLPDKKFRDASDYRAGDKLKTYLERS